MEPSKKTPPDHSRNQKPLADKDGNIIRDRYNGHYDDEYDYNKRYNNDYDDKDFDNELDRNNSDKETNGKNTIEVDQDQTNEEESYDDRYK